MSGQTPPRHEDNEETLGELRARIRKTLAFAESVKAADYAGAGERTIDLSLGPRQGHRRRGLPLQVAIPNIFFHIAMAYAILRQNGVDVGKMDFLGPMNFVPA